MNDELPGLPFTVIGVLGKGGMGVVFHAQDRELDRELAIKVPLATLTGKRRERFLREGQVSAALEHPGILKVHAAGVLDDGRPWIAYELVHDPRPLDALWPEQSVFERVALIRDAARAVGHAHAHGVVHRDIKADNVLVDGEGRVRVADFGLALTAGQDRLTQTGALLGTPSMMSPEQITASKDVGPAVDVWALGVLLYQALTDEHPFDQTGTWQDLMVAISQATPTPPRKLRPDVPRALERVVLRCLRPAPTQRYTDGGALADAIEAAVKGDEPSAPRRLLLAGVALVTLVTVAGFLATRAPEAAPVDAPAAQASATPRPEPSRTADPGLGAVEAKLLEAERLLPKDPEAAGAILRAASADGSTQAATRLATLLAAKRIAALPGESVNKLLQTAARAGDGEACYQLALRLQDGRGIPHDPERAVFLLERGAQAGHIGACGALAQALRLGRGVRKDGAKAIAWARKAALQDNPDGLAILVSAYLNGLGGTEPSRSEAKAVIDRLVATGHPMGYLARGAHAEGVGPAAALAWYRKGAALNDGGCLYQVGYAYERGHGVTANQASALAWYRRSAATGDRQGLRALARFLLRGTGGIEPDPDEAFRILSDLAKRGFPKAIFDLARCHAGGYGTPIDLARSTRLFRQAAGWGLPRAAYHYADALETGRGVPVDFRAAAHYYEEALKGGYARGYTGLGQMLKLGLGTKQNLKRAHHLFTQGAAAGDRDAAYRLGLMYMRGVPAGKNDVQAAKLFRAAGGADHPKAAFQFARALEEGRGVQKNLAEAVVWYRRAARWNVPAARVRLAKMHLNGEHLKRDVAAGAALLEQAAAQGSAEAKALLKQLKR